MRSRRSMRRDLTEVLLPTTVSLILALEPREYGTLASPESLLGQNLTAAHQQQACATDAEQRQ